MGSSLGGVVVLSSRAARCLETVIQRMHCSGSEDLLLGLESSEGVVRRRSPCLVSSVGLAPVHGQIFCYGSVGSGLKSTTLTVNAGKPCWAFIRI